MVNSLCECKWFPSNHNYYGSKEQSDKLVQQTSWECNKFDLRLENEFKTTNKNLETPTL